MLLQYRRSQFYGNPGTVGQGDERPLETAFNKDVSSGIEHDDGFRPIPSDKCPLHSGDDGRHVEKG